jgi:hypothetical protein
MCEIDPAVDHEIESSKGQAKWDNKPLPFPCHSSLPLGIIPGLGEQDSEDSEIL